jgi:hypothetical protein
MTEYLEFVQTLHRHMSSLEFAENANDKVIICISILRYILKHEEMLEVSNPSFDAFKSKLFLQIQKMQNTDYRGKDVDAENVEELVSLCREFNCYF